ncbi:MAG TPA: hypothetical protein VKK79_09520 [Candidatus Lokiarchaeia archaeon]|nr:hypothetical protein [Candidatus Lokiarchaeia archaeon]
MTQARADRAREKWNQEIDHFHRLQDRGWDSLGITDDLIHQTLQMLRAGIMSRFPQATEIEVKQKMRESILFYEKLKQRGRATRHGRA